MNANTNAALPAVGTAVIVRPYGTHSYGGANNPEQFAGAVSAHYGSNARCLSIVVSFPGQAPPASVRGKDGTMRFEPRFFGGRGKASCYCMIPAAEVG